MLLSYDALSVSFAGHIFYRITNWTDWDKLPSRICPLSHSHYSFSVLSQLCYLYCVTVDKITASGCAFNRKMHKNTFFWQGSAPPLWGSLQRFPNPDPISLV